MMPDNVKNAVMNLCVNEGLQIPKSKLVADHNLGHPDHQTWRDNHWDWDWLWQGSGPQWEWRWCWAVSAIVEAPQGRNQRRKVSNEDIASQHCDGKNPGQWFASKAHVLKSPRAEGKNVSWSNTDHNAVQFEVENNGQCTRPSFVHALGLASQCPSIVKIMSLRFNNALTQLLSCMMVQLQRQWNQGTVLNTMLVYHVHNAHTIVFVYNAWIKALSLRTIKPERENNTARVITQLGRDNWGQTQSGSDNRGDWQLEQWNFTGWMDGWMECILRTRLTTVVNFLLAAKTGELLRRDVETSRSLLQDSLCFRYCSSLVRSWWQCPRASFFLHPSYHPSQTH